MFGFFKKKIEIEIKDLVWKTDVFKYQSLAKSAKQLDKLIVVYYFEDTKKELESVFDTANITYTDTNSFAAKVWLMQANNLLHKLSVDDRIVIFAEHHPSFIKEKEVLDYLLEKLNVRAIKFYISLEDELLKHFGSERIVQMLEKMGFKDDEMIEHNMISRSIQNAQKKIDEQVQLPSNTRNSRDWFKLNVVK